MTCEWHDKIFSANETESGQLALDIFQFQFASNPVYQSYVTTIGADLAGIDSVETIPFLPIRFFKTDRIMAGEFNPELKFESSGTTLTTSSKHYVKDASLYIESFNRTFRRVYGNINEWCILGLLPSYLEKGNSSLVYMVGNLIDQSNHSQSGFYLYDLEKLKTVLQQLEDRKQKTLLIGVTYALLDFAEKFPMPLRYTTIIETGGMKGRREELTRMEVHERLKKAFVKNEIHSEYGMTELLSQAYSIRDGRFTCPPWMRILIRDEEDPFLVQGTQLRRDSYQVQRDDRKPLTGAINIIDLANVYSCSFIATDDIGKLYEDGSFEVLGRMDGSDLRGCSLLTV